MGYCISVFLMPRDALAQAMGSRNDQLVSAVKANQAWLLSSADDIDDEAQIDCATAVRNLVHGESDDSPGYLYGYALKALCQQLGRELPEIAAISGAFDWVEEIDAALAERSVPLALSDLIYAGSPVDIPEPEDFPAIGHWQPETITQAHVAMAALDLVQEADGDLRETLEQIRGWLDAAVKAPGASVIGFLA